MRDHVQLVLISTPFGNPKVPLHVHPPITNPQRDIRSDNEYDTTCIFERATRVNTMRYRTLEIRWHDSKPISTCDFQPIPFKKARPSQEKNFASQSYKLATGGEDNHVRVR